MSNPLRKMLTNTEIYNGVTMPVYLETVPGSIEKICAAVAVLGEDGQFKVVRTLHPRTIKQLFGSKSEGINKAINWICTSLNEQLQQGVHLADCSLPLTGFYCSQPDESAAQNLNGLVDKTIGLATAVGGTQIDDEEKQARFSTQLRSKLTQYNKEYTQYINQSFQLGRRKVRFGLVTPDLVGQYHGIYANRASLNSAIVKMVALEDLRLDGLIESNMDIKFYAAKTDRGDASIQNSLLSDLEYELDKRKIPLRVFNDHREMAKHFHSILANQPGMHRL